MCLCSAWHLCGTVLVGIPLALCSLASYLQLSFINVIQTYLLITLLIFFFFLYVFIPLSFYYYYYYHHHSSCFHFYSYLVQFIKVKTLIGTKCVLLFRSHQLYSCLFLFYVLINFLLYLSFLVSIQQLLVKLPSVKVINDYKVLLDVLGKIHHK